MVTILVVTNPMQGILLNQDADGKLLQIIYTHSTRRFSTQLEL